MKRKKYYYLGSYVIAYSISNPNLYDSVLVSEDNPNIDYNIYKSVEDGTILPIRYSDIALFEKCNDILPLYDNQYGNSYRTYLNQGYSRSLNRKN